jgi:hypothetical protein
MCFCHSASPELCLHMLETVRSYPFEELARGGGLDAARERWLAYLLDLAEPVGKSLMGRGIQANPTTWATCRCERNRSAMPR